MRTILLRLLKLFLTAVLLFLSVGLAEALARLPVRLDRDRVILPLVCGFGGGLLFFSLVSRFLILYVFGHELTHWLAAKLFRRRTGRFRIGATSGSVAIERPNIWITLAPYVVPVYAVGSIGAYGVVSFFMTPTPIWLTKTAMAVLGITYAFHVRLTVHALSRPQSDFAAYGVLFSLAFVFFCNVALLFCALVIATSQWGHGIVLLTAILNRNGQALLDGLLWCRDWVRTSGLFPGVAMATGKVTL